MPAFCVVLTARKRRFHCSENTPDHAILCILEVEKNWVGSGRKQFFPDNRPKKGREKFSPLTLQ
jgi:hypothetical protein